MKRYAVTESLWLFSAEIKIVITSDAEVNKQCIILVHEVMIGNCSVAISNDVDNVLYRTIVWIATLQENNNV